jgi:hypothetical protein
MAGRPLTLTTEMVDIAFEVSAKGGALPTVARACRAPLRNVQRWIEKAKDGTGSELHDAFWRAIQDGRHRAEIRAIGIITGSEDPRDAQWWLTHNPTTRETWSDAAAERRAVAVAMAPITKALATLPPEQRLSLMLAIEAEGGRLPDAEDESDD